MDYRALGFALLLASSPASAQTPYDPVRLGGWVDCSHLPPRQRGDIARQNMGRIDPRGAMIKWELHDDGQLTYDIKGKFDISSDESIDTALGIIYDIRKSACPKGKKI
jgi:hypothetical protein